MCKAQIIQFAGLRWIVICMLYSNSILNVSFCEIVANYLYDLGTLITFSFRLYLKTSFSELVMYLFFSVVWDFMDHHSLDANAFCNTFFF